MPEKILAKFEVCLIADEDGKKGTSLSIQVGGINRAEMALLYFELRNQLRCLEPIIDAVENGKPASQLGIRDN
jgi:hypothetical protein